MNQRPRIALSSCMLHQDMSRTTFNGRPLVYAEQSMLDWLLAGGCLPFMLPPISGARPVEASYADLLEPFDALVLQGGVDASPTSYGETPLKPEWSGDRIRDDYEIALIRAAMDANMPVLGICRGHQLINVALGGTLYQDIQQQNPGSIQHRNPELYERNRHEVDFVPNEFFHKTFGVQRANVNSVHHQAIKDVAPSLEVQARASDDDTIEAVWLPTESISDPWVVGVQWHPEFQDPNDGTLLPTQPILDALYQAIVERA